MKLRVSILRAPILAWAIAGFILASVTLVLVNTGQAQKAPKAPATMHDLLAPYTGYDTNMGKIKRVTTDFVLIQEENAQSVIPWGSIQTVRFVKENVAEPVKIDIRLVAKD